MAIQATAAKVSSTALRLSALLFFRFFPAHFPTAIFALFVVYVPSFYATFVSEPALEIVDDEVDVVVTEKTIQSSTPLLTEDGVALVPEPEVVTEVGLEETITLAEENVRGWKILLHGAPSPRRLVASGLTFLINLILVGLTTDALYRARWFYPADDLSFVRLGYLAHDEVKFLIREPDQDQMPITLAYRIKNPELPYDNIWWQTAGTLQSTTNETDFTGTITTSLSSHLQRVYEWRTTNNHTGEFSTPPKPGVVSDYHGGKFTFLSTSCILPRFPYSPIDHPLAIPGLRHLARKLPDLGAQFMLFLGDFIYVDVPERFGKSVEEYRMQYRQVYASPDFAAVSQNLSWIHVLDDHEISNDWSSNTTGIYDNAVEPWHLYHADVNPPRALTAGSSRKRRAEATWYEFSQGPASFFMMDTRSYRSSNNVAFEESDKTMLGPDQLADFLAWLARPEPQGVRWKIVASSVPFTKNWPVNVKDTWGGFLVERKKILEAMWDTGAKGTGVVILSGDRHEFAATKFPPPPDSRWPESATAFEFSTSPLNQFASPFGTYKQKDDEDVKLGYISGGNSKFASFTFEDIAGESTLQYHLYIDGEEKWSTLLMAPPVTQSGGTFTSFFDKIKFA